jgi:hypothetical protein
MYQELTIEIMVTVVLVYVVYLLFHLSKSVDEDGRIYKNLKWFLFSFIVFGTSLSFLILTGGVPDGDYLGLAIAVVPFVVFVIVVLRQKIEEGLSFVQYFTPMTFILFQVVKIPIGFILTALDENANKSSDIELLVIDIDILVGIIAVPVTLWMMRGRISSWQIAKIYNVLGIGSGAMVLILEVSLLLSSYPNLMLVFLLQLSILVHIVSLKHMVALTRVKSKSYSRSS